MLLFLPLAHVFGRVIQFGALSTRTVARPHPGRQEPARRPRRVPADVRPGRAAGVREGLQRRPARGADADGKGKIFDAAADTAIAWSRGAGHRRRRACCCGCSTRCSTSWSTASCAPPSAAACSRRDLRRRAAGRAARPLLPRHRRHGLRGLRPDRDHAPATRSTRCDAQRIGTRRPAAARLRCGSPTTARSCSRGRSCSAATGTTRRPPRRRSTRRLVPHRRPRRARRRRLPEDHRPQEGDHRHRGRQERRPGGARGPAPRAPAGQPVHGGRRRAAVHRRADHPGRRGAARLAGAATASRPATTVAEPGRRPATCAPRSRRRSTTPTRRCRRPRRSRSSASCRPTSPRTAASSRRP